MRLLLALLLILATPALAWDTPARGTQLRSDLMNAIRPAVEADLGAPVIFVVQDLRYAGNVAFAALDPPVAKARISSTDSTSTPCCNMLAGAGRSPTFPSARRMSGGPTAIAAASAP